MNQPEDPHCPRCGTRLNRNATHNPDCANENALEVIRLRRQRAAQARLTQAQAALAELIPEPYAIALHDAYFIAHGQPVTSQETPGRMHPSSEPPGYNPAGYDIIQREQRTLIVRSGNLERATRWAAEHPDTHTPRRNQRIA